MAARSLSFPAAARSTNTAATDAPTEALFLKSSRNRARILSWIPETAATRDESAATSCSRSVMRWQVFLSVACRVLTCELGRPRLRPIPPSSTYGGKGRPFTAVLVQVGGGLGH